MIGQGKVPVGDNLFGQLSSPRLVLHGRGGNEQHPRQECLGRHATGIAGRGEGRRMRHAILQVLLNEHPDGVLRRTAHGLVRDGGQQRRVAPVGRDAHIEPSADDARLGGDLGQVDGRCARMLLHQVDQVVTPLHSAVELLPERVDVVAACRWVVVVHVGIPRLAVEVVGRDVLHHESVVLGAVVDAIEQSLIVGIRQRRVRDGRGGRIVQVAAVEGQ